MLHTLIFMSAIIASATTAFRVMPFGIVEGVRDCGSSGRFGTLTLDDCNAVPCTFEPTRLYNYAVRFVASTTSRSLSLHIYVLQDEDVEILLLELGINGEIQAGIEYELTFQGRFPSDFSGLNFELRNYIMDLENDIKEVCYQLPVIIS